MAGAAELVAPVRHRDMPLSYNDDEFSDDELFAGAFSMLSVPDADLSDPEEETVESDDKERAYSMLGVPDEKEKVVYNNLLSIARPLKLMPRHWYIDADEDETVPPLVTKMPVPPLVTEMPVPPLVTKMPVPPLAAEPLPTDHKMTG